MKLKKCTSPMEFSRVEDLFSNVLFIWQEGSKREKPFAQGSAHLSVPVSCKVLYSSYS